MLRPLSVAAIVVVALGASLHGSQNAPQGIPDDFAITLARTSCFGACPVYAVSIDAKGTVKYEGKKFVRVTGRQSDQIPVSRVAELLATVDRIRFFELDDRYRVIRNPDGTTTMVTDLPTTFVTVTRGGKTKSIEDYVGAPESLKQFEKQIDEVARTKRWVTVDEPMLRQMVRDGWTPSAEERAELPVTYEPNLTEVLLTAGIPPDQPDLYGRTPLLQAACAGNAQVVKLLLARGADPTRHPPGESALECARSMKDYARLYPHLNSTRPIVADFDAVIVLLEQALATRRR